MFDFWRKTCKVYSPKSAGVTRENLLNQGRLTENVIESTKPPYNFFDPETAHTFIFLA